ncbi:hypothetical protein P7F88_04270 [Vibrio hannami]|uniref:aldose epimerase family protein n=1 Tax=Vibrio hannami TaxID=2717094 RepID=UPI00240FD2F0|nr:hypothetical protein [Vibrio hannami]MDG3085359.1 hypothetical protein [Vibrio hannami]
MSTLVSISKNGISATINSLGAELITLRRGKNPSIIWSGEEWRCSAPWLFPIVGNLPESCYTYKGNSYEMERHGFARNKAFLVTQQTDSSVSLMLESDSETILTYPFQFRFLVTYSIENEGINISAKIENSGNEDMLFSLGYHPGFVCDQEGELVFGTPPSSYFYGENGFVSFDNNKQRPIKNNLLALDMINFSRGAIYIKNIEKQLIKLKTGGQVIALRVPSCPYLMIWREPGAKFICIEPCFGITEPYVDSQISFENKPGLRELGRGSCFRTEYEINLM